MATSPPIEKAADFNRRLAQPKHAKASWCGCLSLQGVSLRFQLYL
jgi:hypothetical protein